MPVSPQLPSGWIPIVQPYTGTDPALRSLQQLKQTIKTSPKRKKSLFIGITEVSFLEPLGIRPSNARWKPTDDEEHRERQLAYLDLCTVIRTLQLVSGDKNYDAEFRGWLKENHGLVSKSVDDAFQIEDGAELQKTKDKLETKREAFWQSAVAVAPAGLELSVENLLKFVYEDRTAKFGLAAHAHEGSRRLFGRTEDAKRVVDLLMKHLDPVAHSPKLRENHPSVFLTGTYGMGKTAMQEAIPDLLEEAFPGRFKSSDKRFSVISPLAAEPTTQQQQQQQQQQQEVSTKVPAVVYRATVTLQNGTSWDPAVDEGQASIAWRMLFEFFVRGEAPGATATFDPWFARVRQANFPSTWTKLTVSDALLVIRVAVETHHTADTPAVVVVGVDEFQVMRKVPATGKPAEGARPVVLDSLLRTVCSSLARATHAATPACRFCVVHAGTYYEPLDVLARDASPWIPAKVALTPLDIEKHVYPLVTSLYGTKGKAACETDPEFRFYLNLLSGVPRPILQYLLPLYFAPGRMNCADAAASFRHAVAQLQVLYLTADFDVPDLTWLLACSAVRHVDAQARSPLGSSLMDFQSGGFCTLSRFASEPQDRVAVTVPWWVLTLIVQRSPSALENSALRSVFDAASDLAMLVQGAKSLEPWQFCERLLAHALTMRCASLLALGSPCSLDALFGSAHNNVGTWLNAVSVVSVERVTTLDVPLLRAFTEKRPLHRDGVTLPDMLRSEGKAFFWLTRSKQEGADVVSSFGLIQIKRAGNVSPGVVLNSLDGVRSGTGNDVLSKLPIGLVSLMDNHGLPTSDNAFILDSETFRAAFPSLSGLARLHVSWPPEDAESVKRAVKANKPTLDRITEIAYSKSAFDITSWDALCQRLKADPNLEIASDAPERRWWAGKPIMWFDTDATVPPVPPTETPSKRGNLATASAMPTVAGPAAAACYSTFTAARRRTYSFAPAFPLGRGAMQLGGSRGNAGVALLRTAIRLIR